MVPRHLEDIPPRPEMYGIWKQAYEKLNYQGQLNYFKYCLNAVLTHDRHGNSLRVIVFASAIQNVYSCE